MYFEFDVFMNSKSVSLINELKLKSTCYCYFQKISFLLEII